MRGDVAELAVCGTNRSRSINKSPWRLVNTHRRRDLSVYSADTHMNSAMTCTQIVSLYLCSICASIRFAILAPGPEIPHCEKVNSKHQSSTLVENLTSCIVFMGLVMYNRINKLDFSGSGGGCLQ